MRKIHHIGWIVRNIEESLPSVRSLLGDDCRVGEIVRDPEREVRVCFVEGHYTIELIEPDGSASPLHDLLKRTGPAPYHVCIEVEDMDAELARVTERGGIVVSGKSPAPAIDHRPVAFMYDPHLGLIELVE